MIFKLAEVNNETSIVTYVACTCVEESVRICFCYLLSQLQLQLYPNPTIAFANFDFILSQVDKKEINVFEHGYSIILCHTLFNTVL